MNTVARTVTTATFAIALVASSITLTASHAEAGPTHWGDFLGVTTSDLGSGR